MPSQIIDSYMYENLKPVCFFNDQTRLCIYEPTHKLYLVKSAAVSYKPLYESLRTLNNPYMAKIYYIADKADHIEIVREYISGDTLADLLKGGKPITPDEAIKIAADICDGLSDMHKMRYVHRDINPNNIIISSDGCAKIIDFGIIRSFSENKNSDTVILGTPGYAAPEQFGFSQSDARTDIYAVGVLLNVMLTNKLPNEQKVQGALGKIIEKCVEIDPCRRYKSIDDLKEALCNKMPGENALDRIIKQIPGIRSEKTLVVVLAVIGYICVIVLSAEAFFTVKNGAYFPLTVSWLLSALIPFFCFHNFLGIWDKLPFSKGASKRNQRIVYTVLGIVSIIFGLLIFGAIS